jgi:transcriptional regulator with XRE-family HTH domain
MLRAKDLMYGDKLRVLRGGDPQEWLAMQFNISQARLSDFEKGKHAFSEEFIKEICVLFKISVNEFKRPEITPSVTTLLAELEHLGVLSKPSLGLGKKIVNVFLKRRIRVLEKEKYELLWKVSQYEAAIERMGSHIDPAIYVIS